MTAPTDPTPVLESKRAELVEQIREITQLPDELGSISFGKRVGEGTSQAVDRLSAVPAHDNLTAMLADVDRALAKVADGTYGRCDVCGREITPARLAARPWANRCIDHA